MLVELLSRLSKLLDGLLGELLRDKLLHRGWWGQLFGSLSASWSNLSQGLWGQRRLFMNVGLSRDLLVNVRHDLRGSRGSSGQGSNDLKGKV